MKNAIITAALATALLSGCATMQKAEDTLGTPDAFAKCAVADVATTTIGISTGRMVEANPLTKALTIKALGHVAGAIVPVIGLSILGYYALKALNKPAVTATVTGLTCFSAARNVWLIR